MSTAWLLKLCGFGGLDTLSASGSADSRNSIDTEDSSSANTSDSSMPGTYRFEPSESDSIASGTSSDNDNSEHERLNNLSWDVQLKRGGGCTSGLNFNCNVSMVHD